MSIKDDRYLPTGLVDGLPLPLQREIGSDSSEVFRGVARTVSVPRVVLDQAFEGLRPVGVVVAMPKGTLPRLDSTPPEAA